MNITKLIMVFFMTGIVVMGAQSLLEGIASNQGEILSVANLIDELVAMAPLTGIQIAGIIFFGLFFFVASKRD